MSLYQSIQPSFLLTSEWACAKKFDTAHPEGYWAIVHGPTEASQTVIFPIELPAGAIVARAYIKMSFTSYPRGGIAYQRINGEPIPSDGVLDVTVTPDMTSFEAVYTFRGHGTLEEKQGQYSGSLGIGTPTLVIDYVDTAGGETGGDDAAVAVGTATSMRLPRLLDRSLHEKARLQCTSLSLTLNLDPLSTADMGLPWDAPEVSVNDFAELFGPYGSVGIFRIYRTETEPGLSRRCSLRHGIVTLADDLVTAGNAIKAPVGQVFASLFAMQSNMLWLMGDCELPEDLEIVLERRYQTLLAAFSGLTAQLPDGYAWEFDQSVSPWRAHLRAMPEEDLCEMRLNRNLTSLAITVDRDQQCTRVYAFGAGEGEDRIGLENLIGTPYLDADDIEERGIIAQAITNEDIYDALTLKDVAQRFIDRHKDPTVSIQVGALDAYRATGLTFDKFRLGRVCRVPMPAYSQYIRERIVSIAWRDLVKNPAGMTVYLANRLRDATDELAELLRAATSSKLIGGKVESKETSNYLDDVTQSNMLVHYFEIGGYGNAVSVNAKYTPAGECRLVIDGVNEIPADEAADGSVEILRYLKADENGVPTVGQHFVQYSARGAGSVSVSSKITVKSITK